MDDRMSKALDESFQNLQKNLKSVQCFFRNLEKCARFSQISNGPFSAFPHAKKLLCDHWPCLSHVTVSKCLFGVMTRMLMQKLSPIDNLARFGDVCKNMTKKALQNENVTFRN